MKIYLYSQGNYKVLFQWDGKALGFEDDNRCFGLTRIANDKHKKFGRAKFFKMLRRSCSEEDNLLLHLHVSVFVKFMFLTCKRNNCG